MDETWSLPVKSESSSPASLVTGDSACAWVGRVSSWAPGLPSLSFCALFLAGVGRGQPGCLFSLGARPATYTVTPCLLTLTPTPFAWC